MLLAIGVSSFIRNPTDVIFMRMETLNTILYHTCVLQTTPRYHHQLSVVSCPSKQWPRKHSP